MKCEECGMSYELWEMTEEPCEGSGDCHDWEGSLDDDDAPQGDYRLTADGERVWAVGGFISYD